MDGREKHNKGFKEDNEIISLIDYVEKIMGLELLEYQKRYIEDIYDRYKTDGLLTVCYPKGHGLIEVNVLRTIVAAYSRGLGKEGDV